MKKVIPKRRGNTMLHTKLLKTVAPAIICMYIISCGDSMLHAADADQKHNGNGLSSEHTTRETPMCPYCKETYARAEHKKALAVKDMVCPHCKSTVSKLDVYHCDLCKKDVLVCGACKKASADLKAAIMVSSCPNCGEICSRYVNAKVLAKWKTKCPNCRRKSQEWLIQHCETCGINFLVCPNCKKEQERFQK